MSYLQGDVAAARAEVEAVLEQNPADASALFASACFELESSGPGAAKELVARLKRLSPVPPQARVLEELMLRREQVVFEPIEDALVFAWHRAGRPDLSKARPAGWFESWPSGEVIPPLATATLKRMNAAEQLLFAARDEAERLRLALLAADTLGQNPLVVDLEILAAVAPYGPLPPEHRQAAKQTARRVAPAVAQSDPANGYLEVAAWLAMGEPGEPMSVADLSTLEAAAARPRFEVPRRDLLEQLRVLAARFDSKTGELRARSAAMGVSVPLYRLWQRAEATLDDALRKRAAALLTKVAERLACSGTMLERMLGASLAGKGAALSGDDETRLVIKAEIQRIQGARLRMTEAQARLGMWPFAGPWREWDADHEMQYFESLIDPERPRIVAGLTCRSRPEPRRAWAEPGARQVRDYHKGSGLLFSPCSDEACLARAERELRPAHLFRAYFTIEGTPAFQDLFVVPTGKVSKAVHFADFSRDYWGGCRVTMNTCPTAAAATSDRWDTMGCSPNKTMFEARPCVHP